MKIIKHLSIVSVTTVLLILSMSAFSMPVSSGSAIDSKGIEIHRPSYVLGGISAFAEIVAAGVKKLALSSPMPPDKMDEIMYDAKHIAKRYKVKLYRDSDFLVTDLFPEDVAKDMDVLLIYMNSTLEEYNNLKARKKKLVDSGKYKGAERETIARGLGKLLSYSKEKVDSLLKEHGKGRK